MSDSQTGSDRGSDRAASSPEMSHGPMRASDRQPLFMAGAAVRQPGAMLSTDFASQNTTTPNNHNSNYGGTQTAATARTRNSNGSGESGMGNSQRTAFISQPIPAGNSLGWA